MSCSFLTRTHRHVPPELAEEAKASPAGLDLALVDKRDQEYVAPKKVFQPFAGSGHQLGAYVAVRLRWYHSLYYTLTQ